MKEKILEILKRDIHLDDEWVADEIMKLLLDKVAKMNIKTIRFEKGETYRLDTILYVPEEAFDECFDDTSRDIVAKKSFTVTITVSEDDKQESDI